MFVDVGYDDTEEDQTVTVRLSAQHANATPVAVALATMGIEEVIALASRDGVFRGGPERVPPGRGRLVPPMRLGPLGGSS